MKRILCIILCLAMFFALFTGCAKTDDPGKDGQDANLGNTEKKDNEEKKDDKKDDTEDKKDDNNGRPVSSKDSMNVSLQSSITTFCPMETNLAINTMLSMAIFSGLTDFDENWDIVPNLAESWDISEDGKTYTYTLRDDVTFHSGDKMTADDVVFSVERGRASSYLAATFGKYCAGAEAIDDTHVALYLNEPYTPFLSIVSKELVIHNRSYYEDFIAAGHTEAEYLMCPDGTGPYKFVSYEDGVSLELEAYDGYFKGEAPIKYFHGKIITDNNARALALEAGDIDIVTTQTKVPDAAIETLRNTPNVVVVDTDFETVGSVMMNQRLPEFQDVRVRKALAYAVDYDWLIETQTSGSGYPTECAYLGHKAVGFSTADTIVNYNYDLEKAKELLAEAGYPNGEGFPVIKAVITEQRKGCMEVLQECWNELGLTTEINIVESSSVWNEIDAGNYSVGVVFNNCMPDSSMYDWYFGDPDTGANNRTHYINPELWKMQEQAAMELDPVKRQELFDSIWSLITDQAPVIWMYYECPKMFHAKGLHISGTYPTHSVVHWDEFYWE